MATTAVARSTPAPRKYLRFFLMNRGYLIIAAGILAGGWWMWLGFVFHTVFGVTYQGKEDLSVDEYDHPWILDLPLYLTLPLVLATLFFFAWMLGAPGADLFGFGRFVLSTFGYDIFAARAATNGWHLLGATLSVGTMVGTGIVIGHELTHRTQNFWAMLIGRWILAAPLDASFAIEHVYGHHTHIGTERDPATARRGESVYRFMVRSIVFGNVSGWRIERERLHKRGYRTFTWRNRMLRGYAMSLVFAAFFYYAAGPTGVVLYVIAGLYGKSMILERVNYVEHYGLVRVPGELVLPRHSWNSNHGGAVLLNVSRHSHHHHDASIPYFRLEPMKDQPTMPYGYAKMIYISLVPPIWRRLIVPKLKEWDLHYASPAECRLAREANLRSGIPELVEFARTQPV